MIGFDVSKQVIDDLFDEYDPDKSGMIEFDEMHRLLRGSASNQHHYPRPAKPKTHSEDTPIIPKGGAPAPAPAPAVAANPPAAAPAADKTAAIKAADEVVMEGALVVRGTVGKAVPKAAATKRPATFLRFVLLDAAGQPLSAWRESVPTKTGESTEGTDHAGSPGSSPAAALPPSDGAAARPGAGAAAPATSEDAELSTETGGGQLVAVAAAAPGASPPPAASADFPAGSMARTASQPYSNIREHYSWGESYSGGDLRLELPRGWQSPPSLRIELWEDANFAATKRVPMLLPSTKLSPFTMAPPKPDAKLALVDPCAPPNTPLATALVPLDVSKGTRLPMSVSAAPAAAPANAPAASKPAHVAGEIGRASNDGGSRALVTVSVPAAAKRPSSVLDDESPVEMEAVLRGRRGLGKDYRVRFSFKTSI